jgi:hypothetical protein
MEFMTFFRFEQIECYFHVAMCHDAIQAYKGLQGTCRALGASKEGIIACTNVYNSIRMHIALKWYVVSKSRFYLII